MTLLNRTLSGLTANTFLLALASLFADTSAEMLYPVLPVFLTQTLGANAAIVGLVDGTATAAQHLVQPFSGWLCDRRRRRKPVALVGYAVAAIAKPLIGLSSAWSGVLAARGLDRLGSGLRSAPRDALVASSAAEGHAGKAFGLEGFGDNLGACLGPLLALTLIGVFRLDLRTLFLLAFLPGSLAFLMVACVREPAPKPRAGTGVRSRLGAFSKEYKAYLLATALFGLGNSSNAFLILRSQDLGASLETTILVYALFNLVAALASIPAGLLADNLGRKGVLLISLAVFAVVYAGFATATDVVLLGALFVLYGLHLGVYRAVGKAVATDLVPADLRASGIGLYTGTIGLTGLFASIVGGQLWTRISPTATFFFGAGCAVLGGLALLLFVPESRKRRPREAREA